MNESLFAKVSQLDTDNNLLKDEMSKLEEKLKNFNTKLSDTRSRLVKEKTVAVEALKVEIKGWKKDLGTERKLKINLEKKLNKIKSKFSYSPVVNFPQSSTCSSSSPPSSDMFCYICAQHIQNYAPKLFLGNEMNPTCKTDPKLMF